MHCLRSIKESINALSFVLVMALAGGCSAKLPAGHEVENPGHLLVSLETTQQQSLHSFELDIEPVKSGVGGALSPLRAVIRLCRSRSMLHCDLPDYRHGDNVGLVVARRLPAGRYVIRAVRVVILEPHGGFGLFNLGPKQALNIPFTIKPGVTSYLGRYRLLDIVGQASNSNGRGKSADVRNTDEASFDIASASVKMPHLFKNVVDYRPDARSRELMKRLTKPHHIQRDDMFDIRSERTTDGREMGRCDWWC